MRRIFTILIAVLLTACSTATPVVPTSTALPVASATPLPTATAQAAAPVSKPTATSAPTATATSAPSATPAAEASPTPASAAAAPSPEVALYSLAGAAWQWVGTDLAGNSYLPADPSRYALAFLADGKLAVQADCAPTSGSYQADGSTLKITADPLDSVCLQPGQAFFLKSIRSAASYAFQNGSLVIALSGGGSLTFSPRALLTPLSATPGSDTADLLSFASVRSGPGLNYPVYGVMLNGMTAELVGRHFDSGWWAIKLPGYPDQLGWLEPTLVKANVSDKTPYLRIENLQAGDKLLWPDNSDPRASIISPASILAGPGPAYPMVLMGLPGDTFFVTGVSADSQYFAIYLGPERISGGTAWIKASDTDANNTEQLPVVPAPPVPTSVRFYQPAAGDPLEAALTIINIRSGPGEEYTALTTANRGEYAPIIGVSVDRLWWQIRVSTSLSADGTAWVAQSVVRAVNTEKVTRVVSVFQFPYARPDTLNPPCTVVSRSPADLSRFDQGTDFTLKIELRNDSGETWSRGDIDFVYIDNVDDALFHIGPNRIDLDETVTAGNTTVVTIPAEAPHKHAGLFGERWVVRKAGATVCSFTFQIRLNP